MAKSNFTAPRVAEFRCEPGKQQTIHWDAKTLGFGLRVTQSGNRSYILESRLHGRTIRCTIGDPSSWMLEDARTEAARLKVLIDQGIDPREVKAEQRVKHEALRSEKTRKEATVGDAWSAYLIYQTERQERAQDKAWGHRHMQDHIRLAAPGGEPKKRGKGVTMAGPLAELMTLKVSELNGERIAGWLASHSSERATMAALAYRLLRAFIRWCEDTPAWQQLFPADAYKSRAVKEAVPRTKAKAGDCLEREQLAAWFESVRRIGNPVISAYLQALLLTGARREEMAALRWQDVDFTWRKMSLADKVEDDGRTIPLTPYLSSILNALPRRNDWVFSSPTSVAGKIAEPRIAHRQALAEAGLPHVSLHGLRRSFGTLAEWVECPVGVVAQIQGHKPSAIAEKHYRRRPIDLLRKWHDQIESWMLEQAGIEYNAAQSAERLHLVSSE
ncbi:tyrosine-type recombinase/integrase [Silvimonas iriomotensis]|uniref:Prophage integrase IntF n=1 Tax=Silvimonas iriomotensis TaxID=449662 RepID=A0ABQ2PCD1_9NEIS|nr:integrase family protein [Silvimonas iriomotensis]GGP23028.1 prophage integrase IntF [Silvimonas iriomotensis]